MEVWVVHSSSNHIHPQLSVSCLKKSLSKEPQELLEEGSQENGEGRNQRQGTAHSCLEQPARWKDQMYADAGVSSQPALECFLTAGTPPVGFQARSPLLPPGRQHPPAAQLC